MGTTRNGGGRSSTRDDRIEMRLGAAEKQAFQEAAESAGLSLSAWIRERLRRAARDELGGLGRPVPFLEKPPA